MLSNWISKPEWKKFWHGFWPFLVVYFLPALIFPNKRGSSGGIGDLFFIFIYVMPILWVGSILAFWMLTMKKKFWLGLGIFIGGSLPIIITGLNILYILITGQAR